MNFDELAARLGRFNIDDRILHRNTDHILEIMKHVIVVRCEHLYHCSRFEYLAYSPLFDKVLEGCAAPHYDMWIIENDDGTLTVEAKKTDL